MGSSSKKDIKKGKSVAKLPETDKKKRQQPQAQPSYDEFMADVGSEYSTEDYEAGPSNAIGAQSNYPRHKAVQSESAVTLQGPLQVAGGVVSGGNVTLSGDFDIRGRIDSYGTIDISGNVVCSGQIQAYGNIVVRGTLGARSVGTGSCRMCHSLTSAVSQSRGSASCVSWAHAMPRTWRSMGTWSLTATCGFSSLRTKGCMLTSRTGSAEISPCMGR
jgi:hypothetical protein